MKVDNLPARNENHEKLSRFPFPRGYFKHPLPVPTRRKETIRRKGARRGSGSTGKRKNKRLAGVAARRG